MIQLIIECETKKCTKCNEIYPASEEYYYKQKYTNKSIGIFYKLSSWCKKCSISKSKDYQDSHKEMHSKSQMKYAKTKKGKEVTKKESRKWREKGGQREYYKLNKDKYIAYQLRNKTIKMHDITDEEWYYCLDYFNSSCAYCGLSEQNQYDLFNQQLHREHVIHSGSNYIDNCVPACTECNTSKHDSELNDWYNENNENYSKRRYNKIINWMTKECFKVLNLT